MCFGLSCFGDVERVMPTPNMNAHIFTYGEVDNHTEINIFLPPRRTAARCFQTKQSFEL